MRSVMKQEALMSWYRIAGSWKRLKDEIVFQWCRMVDDKGTSFDLIGAEMSSGRQNSDVQTSVIRPDDHGKRSEFSLHIGC
jgi:tyrosyl-tRNA synthetase